MQHALMTNSDIVPDNGGASARYRGVVVRYVDDGPVLNAGARTDANVIDVAANRHLRPDRRIGTDDDIADDGGKFVDINTRIDFWHDIFIGSDRHGSPQDR